MVREGVALVVVVVVVLEQVEVVVNVNANVNANMQKLTQPASENGAGTRAWSKSGGE